MKNKYKLIENLYFPPEYLFSFKDPNGALWIKKEDSNDDVYKLGISSLAALKLEKLVKFTLLDVFKNNDMLIESEIFLFLKGFNYEMNLFSPFNAKIIEINPIIMECSEERPVILTQEDVYEDLWLLRVEYKDELNLRSDWLIPEDKKFERLIKMIIKGDKKLQDRCCPNLFDSDVVRRMKSNK